MKSNLFFAVVFFIACFSNSLLAQQGSKKPLKKVIHSKAITTSSDEVASLQRPENDKNNPIPPSRGEIYGKSLTDLIVDNFTGFYIDIYVNGNYRGTVAPYDKRVTWAIPGNNILYAKAPFGDGSYYFWGPLKTNTQYQYTWKLYK
ncbi:MAG: hypothetical protein N2747_00715 [Chitinophagaceae bacterium]|nr:hypothetical protein [Chitinophagaceae bacterium]